MKVESIYCRMLPLEHSAILLTCIKQFGLEKQFLVFFRVAILDRFYCTLANSENPDEMPHNAAFHQGTIC